MPRLNHLQSTVTPHMSTLDLVTIQKFGTPQDAHLARSVLDAAGIVALVTDEAAATWMWHVGTALGGARVQVAARDAARARQVLQEMAVPVAQGDSDDWTCPQCGAEVDAGFDICWSCETPRGQTLLPSLRPKPVQSSVPSSDPDELFHELPGDVDAVRAWRATLFGVFFPPLFLYAFYLVLKNTDQELSSRGTRHFFGALAVSLLVIALLAAALIQWR